MRSQLTTDEQALRLFFTDDIYLVGESQIGEESLVQTTASVSSAPGEPIQEVTETEVLSESLAPAYKFLGSNKRNILILVSDEENEVSDEKGRELLRKILKSVNLTANDFALLNYAAYRNTTFEQLQSYFSSVLVLVFGVSATELGLSAQPQNTIVAHGLLKMIFSSELKKLDQDPGAKKLLWGSLQQLGL